MSTQSERLAVAEQRLADHEARCEERLSEIRATAGSTLRAVEGLKNRSWGVILALLAWALAQVWSATTAPVTSLKDARSSAQGAMEIATAPGRAAQA